MAKNLQISYLLDFYGQMLSQKQQEILDDYYNSDLSLAEIAEDKEMTRQGVRDHIKRSETQLFDMEEKLGLYSRFIGVTKKLEEIISLSNKILEKDKLNENAKKITNLAKELID